MTDRPESFYYRPGHDTADDDIARMVRTMFPPPIFTPVGWVRRGASPLSST
ncbi:MAG: hypothetical protein JXQ27_17110 [Acidobacteria bacterium]|nr:hypothetical protein [Acidobacteriota bacterium]